MPCSQMIMMNIRPPRPTAARNDDRVPKVKARILNRGSRNIGSTALVSITANAARSTTPAASSPSTGALVQPMLCPSAGSMP